MEQTDLTLFVVDDDPEVRASMAALGTSMGWDCQAFSSAEEFLEHFDPARPGCVVTDLRLEGMDGLQLQEHLANLSGAPPVILISAYGSIPIAVRAMRNGALTVLEKPCDADELAGAIRLAGSIHPSTSGASPNRAGLQFRFDSLDSRERETMVWIIDGVPTKTIARQLDVSPRTANRIRAAVFKKMGVESAVDLARMVGGLQNDVASEGPDEHRPVQKNRRLDSPAALGPRHHIWRRLLAADASADSD
jgi:FixJ family two-component response regulator